MGACWEAMSGLDTILITVVVALLVAAGVIDARRRVFPNWLAGCLALACAALSFSMGGVARLLAHAVLALAVFVVLTLFEVGWRRVRREAGLGMGDVKYLSALMLLDPFFALISFAGGLGALGITGLILRKRALPLLPFAVAAAFALTAAVFLSGRCAMM